MLAPLIPRFLLLKESKGSCECSTMLTLAMKSVETPEMVPPETKAADVFNITEIMAESLQKVLYKAEND